MSIDKAISLLHSASKLRMAKCTNEREAKALLNMQLNELPAEIKSKLLASLRLGSIEKASAAELIAASSQLHSTLTKDPVLGLLELTLFEKIGRSSDLFCFYLDRIAEPLKSVLAENCTETSVTNKFINELSKDRKNERL